MSKTKERAAKEDKVDKKRKRQEVEVEDVAKKSKKSKKSKKPESTQNAPVLDEPIVEKKTSDEKKAEKEEKKKRKKERKDMAATEATEQDVEAKETDDFIPLNGDTPMPDATNNSESKTEKKKSKKDKKEKKAKKAKDAPLEGPTAENEVQNGATESDALIANGADAESESSKLEKKSKKNKKEKKGKKSKKSKADEETIVEEPPAETSGTAALDEQDANEGAEDAVEEFGDPGNNGRFIVFVGNLPYSATKESIAQHFEKLQPKEIRLRTYKGTEKFMGTCFIEFDRFDRMQTCLKKYHHSVFPDSKKKEGRKINVELSAGGGGNSENRKARIAAKNDKLHDERARDREKRAELEMKQSERKEKKEASNKGKKEESKAEPDNGGIHPARLAMMNAPQRPNYRQRY